MAYHQNCEVNLNASIKGVNPNFLLDLDRQFWGFHAIDLPKVGSLGNGDVAMLLR